MLLREHLHFDGHYCIIVLDPLGEGIIFFDFGVDMTPSLWPWHTSVAIQDDEEGSTPSP